VAQIPRHVLYQGSDVLLLRAAARSLDSASVLWPDPADSEELQTWLVKAWVSHAPPATGRQPRCGRARSAAATPPSVSEPDRNLARIIPAAASA
jgi:hypothetical protein